MQEVKMEEAMSHTAHSQYGMDDKVKLPNFTEEEVDWQGLEDLYSINESLYESRPDYRPSLDNWANFQKDVDNMFALRHILNSTKLNQTHKLDDPSLAELGSGAGGGGLGEGSGGEDLSAGDIWPGLVTPNQAMEAPHTTPAPNTLPPPPPPAPPMPSPERKLESVVNDLPERPLDRPGASMMSSSSVMTSGQRRGGAVARGDVWAQQLEEMEGEGLVSSGNGLTELETRHDALLRTHNSLLQAQLEPPRLRHREPAGPKHSLGTGLELEEEEEEEEDIFQAQGYLPLSPQTVRPKVQASTTGSPPTTQTGAPRSVGTVLQTLPLTLDYEGSGSLPQPSNQTL